MEYERCESGSLIVMTATVAMIVILVMYFMMIKEGANDRVDQVISALEATQKSSGTIVDFRDNLKDSRFSALKYIHLTDLYRQGKATRESVAKILADANL